MVGFPLPSRHERAHPDPQESMAKRNQYSFSKRQRELKKKKKQEEKRQRKMEKKQALLAEEAGEAGFDADGFPIEGEPVGAEEE